MKQVNSSEELFDNDLVDEEIESGGQNNIATRVIEKPQLLSENKEPQNSDQLGDNCVKEEKSDVIHSSPNQYQRNLHKPQGPLQPTATYPDSSESRFILFNLEGQIVSHPNDDYRVVQASFHNYQRKRIPLITDMYGFELGAMSSEGLVLASLGDGDKTPVVMVKLFESWATNSDWMLTLSDEEQEVPCCVTIGPDFVAIALKNRTLHLFELSGNVMNVVGLTGDTVAMSAQGDKLAVVTHSSIPSNYRDQKLQVEIFSISQRCKICSCGVALSPKSRLQWIDFSDEGLLCVMDSEGVVWRLNNEFGLTWCPVFDSALQRTDQEVFWPVGIKQRKLACIVCNPEQKYPKVSPQPFLKMISLKVPVLSQSVETANFESEGILLHQDLKSNSFIDEEQAKLVTEKSKTVCSLFWTNVKAEKFQRAYDIARRMDNIKELEVALNMAKKQNRSSLISRIESLIQDLQDRKQEVRSDEQDADEVRTPLSLYNLTTPKTGNLVGSKRKLPNVDNPFSRSSKKSLI